MKKRIISLSIIIIILFGMFLSYNVVSYAQTNDNVSVKYNSHVEKKGWESDFSKADGETSGTTGQCLRVEALKIKVDTLPSGVSIKYRTHIESIGWQDWVRDGQLAGTTGRCLRMEAIQIKLEGTTEYKVQYRAHVETIGWQEWKEGGSVAGTEGKSLRMEAIEIRIVPCNEKVEYSSHVEKLGWEDDFSKANGQISGTTGQYLRVEALKVRLSGFSSDAKIEYQTHVEKIGWQDWVSDGQVAGTTGQSLRVEGIRIKLKNLDNKSVQYRAHVESIGWQDWKTDGQLAGTTGQCLRIEAIEIRLVDKTYSGIQSETEHLKGIDVSTFQHEIDWASVKADGVEFAMIRAGFRGYGSAGRILTDEQFHRNVQNAIANNIKVGVYFFTQAVNVQEAIEEANYTIDLIKNYNITYPVAIDTEWSSEPNRQGRADPLSVEERTAVVKAFCERVKDAGYEPMIYASKWWLIDNLDMSQLSDYDIWLAHYTGATQDNPLYKPSNYEGEYIMWQYSSTGDVNGILGNVDMNITMPSTHAVVGSSLEINEKRIKIFY